MIEHLKSLSVFAEIVREGSFRRAARQLNLTPSAVSYHVRQLEEAVGAPLLYRSTRSMSTTDIGENLYLSASDMLNAAQSGLWAARDFERNLSGRLRVALSTALSRSYISERIAEFAKGHPNIDLNLHYDNRENNLIEESFDLAIRIGQLEDSGLKCKLLWDMPRILVASSDFIERVGSISDVEKLTKQCWIKFEGLQPTRHFLHVNEEIVEVEQSGNVTVNSIEAMVDLTLLGVGVSSPPRHFAEEYLSSGRLVHILPAMEMSRLPVYGIWPPTKIQNPISRLFLSQISL